jgi:two-component system, LuxR family, sensor kinase FixL
LQRKQSAVFKCGLVVLSIAIAVLLTSLLERFVDTIPLFYAAVIVSSWYGGRWAGLLSVFLATVAVDYYLVPPARSFAVNIAAIPYLGTFVLLALTITFLSASRRDAEKSLRQAHAEMEGKVRDRTADLEQINKRLQAEIAERRRIEETLRERANLVDLTHDTVFVRDMSDVITYWNRGAEEQYGWSSEEAIGRVSHELLRTVFPPSLTDIMAELTQTARWEGELTHAKRDGTQVVVASRWALQRDGQERPVAILETNNDVTERKRVEDALGKAQSELAHITRVTTMGELAASIAHEINQPLAAVVTNGNACLRWLTRSQPDLEEARQAAHRIIRDGKRASDVIARIRALLKRTATNRLPLEINEVIEETVALAQNEARRRRVLLRTDFAAKLPSVLGDRVQLQQVILNLVMNGIEAMSSGSNESRQLLIKTQRDDSDQVLVSVRDFGIGLDPNLAERLFEAFFTTKTDGMGMGLSISRSIIEAHGGRLWATPNVGSGATFQFTVPTGSELQA